MRILSLSETYPPETGGGSTYVYNISNRIQSTQTEIVVLTRQSDVPYEDEKNPKLSIMRLQVPSYTKGHYGINLNRLRLIIKMLRMTLKIYKGFDIIHIYSGGATKIVGWILRNLYHIKKPMVLTFLGSSVGWHSRAMHPIKAKFLDMFVRELELGAYYDRYIVVDDGDHSFKTLEKKSVILRKKIPKSRIIRHYQGVDCEKFSPMDVKKSRKTIAFIGRLEPLKGADIFIKALPQILGEIKGAKAIIVGDGPSRLELEKLAKTLNLKQVEFVGSVPHDKVAYYMNLSDCVVFLDLYGFDFPRTLNLTHCEAMACGALILSSSKPREEWNSQTWVEIDNPDISEVSKKIIDVLKTPEKYKQLSINAREIALKHFSWDAVVNIYKEELEHLYKSGRK